MARARATRATDAAKRAGIDHEVIEVDLGSAQPGHAGYGEAVAADLGVDPALVFKTLIATVDGAATVAVVPVTRTLDLKALAAARGGRRATMADPAAAERLTGYVVGGISPLGQRRDLPTVLDESAAALDRVFVSAGRRGLELALSATDLVHLTGAELAPIAR